MSIQVAVNATDSDGRRANPTAIELAAALIFTHRIVNKAFLDKSKSLYGDNIISEYEVSALFAEPALVNFSIDSVGNGSVILNGVLEAARDPFVQGVAAGIVANIMTQPLVAFAKRAKAALRRPRLASAGRTLTVTIRSDKHVLHTHCRYEERQSTEITIREVDNDA